MHAAVEPVPKGFEMGFDFRPCVGGEESGQGGGDERSPVEPVFVFHQPGMFAVQGWPRHIGFVGVFLNVGIGIAGAKNLFPMEAQLAQDDPILAAEEK
jgi:hypothetical protein